MHPGRCASVLLDRVVIGFVGELHPKWRQAYDLAQAPVMFELELDAVLQREVPVYKAVTKHQGVERDIAVLVDEKVTYAALMGAVWAAPTAGLLRDAALFDIYRPKPSKDPDGVAVASAEKSMAVRLTLNNQETTLTEDQIDTTVQTVLSSLVSTLGARQRG
jgi:phenylalanyl-tRNA synthetase beta chain